MTEIMEYVQATFKPMVLIFTVANLGAMGLQVRVPKLIAVFRDKNALALTKIVVLLVGAVHCYPNVHQALGATMTIHNTKIIRL